MSQPDTKSVYRERHPVRISINMSTSTKAKLDQILGSRPRSTGMNDLLLEAVDLYLEHQEDIVGSRQHFNRTLQTRLNKLEAELSRLSMLIMFMMANGFASLAQGYINGKHSPQAANGGFYIKAGVESLITDGEQLAEQLRTIQQSMESSK